MAAGTLRIEFADVPDAELEVTGTAGAERWTFRSEDGELVVASPQGWFDGGWPFGGWPFGERAADDATLVLPESLKGADADLSLAAGELIVDDGDFGEVVLDMGAGRTRMTASVDSITADVSAGAAELELEGAREASFSVSAGALQAALSGVAAPNARARRERRVARCHGARGGVRRRVGRHGRQLRQPGRLDARCRQQRERAGVGGQGGAQGGLTPRSIGPRTEKEPCLAAGLLLRASGASARTAPR